VQYTQEHAELMQNVRAATEQFHRELSQAIINNNRPDGEQVYFEIKQLAPEQSVLRFGCTTERGLVEIGYQVRPSDEGWRNYELWRLYRTRGMWNYNEPDWPALDLASGDAAGGDLEPFAFGIVGFKVRYWSSQYGRWVAGNWESIDRNAMPRKIQIVLKAITAMDAKRQPKVTKIEDLEGIEKFTIEINLPQAR
jgi:hypothetical protein